MKLLCWYLSLVLALGSVSRSSAAQSADHVVSATELHTALVMRSDQRREDLAEIRTLLRNAAVRHQLHGVANLEKIETAIANVDDATLRELAGKAKQANSDVAAEGKMTVAVILIVALIAISIFVNVIPKELD